MVLGEFQQTFTSWRIAGSTHYAFGKAHLNYMSQGSFVKVPNSDVTNTDPLIGNVATTLFERTFSTPITSQQFQVHIETYNPFQTDDAKLELYLWEIQFGYIISPPSISPSILPSSVFPSISPTLIPTETPTSLPTSSPSTSLPTLLPSNAPSTYPTYYPTTAPITITTAPTAQLKNYFLVNLTLSNMVIAEDVDNSKVVLMVKQAILESLGDSSLTVNDIDTVSIVKSSARRRLQTYEPSVEPTIIASSNATYAIPSSSQNSDGDKF